MTPETRRLIVALALMTPPLACAVAFVVEALGV